MEKDIENGVAAEALVNNEFLQSVLQEIEQDVFSVWQSTKTDQINERESAWQTIRGVQLFKMKLQQKLNCRAIALHNKKAE